jgi:F-type H+-transporting ATPase subunit gamma
MANLQEIRRRIVSVKSTQKITRAMKMVAAAKLRRAQESLLNTRPYALHMRAITAGLVASADRKSHPLLACRTGGRVRLVVVTSDRGLCGGFNAGIVHETMKQVETTFSGRSVALTIVGRKGVELFRRRNLPVHNEYLGVFEKFSVSAGVRIVDELVDSFLEGGFNEVHCLYNEFKSAVSQRITVEKLLPYDPEESDQAAPNWIFEPSEDAVLLRLLRANLYAQMHRILHESAASEQGARMSAMDSATKNAGDVLQRLSLEYNRARQDAITSEVVEIISGAEAL